MMRAVPRWALLSAALAPVFLIGGWTLAAARQPAGYSAVTQTISSLAGRGATDRWLMTVAFVGLGVCYLVTALGLRPAAPAGRVALALAGVTTLLVAAFPLPRHGSSAAHTAVAAVSFGALAVWPVLGYRRGPGVPPGLRPGVAVAATVVLLGLVGWFAVELYGGGARIGLAERVAAGAEAIWPFVVVLTASLARRPGSLKSSHESAVQPGEKPELAG
jgi:hypothetical membrane protein